MSLISIQELERLTHDKLPFAGILKFRTEELKSGRAIVRAPYSDEFLRPGGTISGPIMMGLADFAMYAAVLTRVGIVELALTTNLNINFLHRPKPGDLLAKARLIRLGKHLAVGEVEIYVDGHEDMVAYVTSTYSLPLPLSGR
jgi:uncharacterized protein (TIGR00369 family)